MTPQTSTPLEAELAVVRGEQARLDAKCATLTAVVGAVMAILISRTALPVRVVLALSGLVLAASAVVLLAGVLRPRLGATGFAHYAALTPHEIAEVFDRWSDYTTRTDLRFLSGLVLV